MPPSLRTDRCAIESGEGGDAGGLGEQPGPGGTAGLEDGGVARPQADATGSPAQIQPDRLDGVQLGRLGGQEQTPDRPRPRLPVLARRSPTGSYLDFFKLLALCMWHGARSRS